MSEEHRRVIAEAIAAELGWYPAPSEQAKQERNEKILKAADAAYAIARPLIAAEMAGVARDPKLIDQVSRGLAAGWRGNPNMSGDDRDFMPPSMRRRHNEKSADACEFIALAIEAHARKMGEA